MTRFIPSSPHAPRSLAHSSGSDEAPETTGAFDAELLKPERLQASYFYKRTDAARFGGMSSALRDNLSAWLFLTRWIKRL